MPEGVLLHEKADLKYINQIPHVDHGVWLPICLLVYLNETADLSLFTEMIAFADSVDKKSFSCHIELAVTLFEGRNLGFMLAYCDNDGSKEREHFIGSTDIKAVNGNKNLGYITADVFS